MGVSSQDSDLSRYLGVRADEPLLSRTAECRLARRARAGSKAARDELVERNMRLVVRTARKFAGQGLSFEELLQEGSVGLLKAAERFDPALGNRFSTYATWWIHQAVASAVHSKGRLIKLPKHIGETRRTVYTAAREFARVHGREPSPAEVRQISGLRTAEYERAMDVPEASSSLDAPMRSDDPSSATLGTIIADPGQGEELTGTVPSLPERLEISRALKALGERHRWVIERRYGLDGGSGATQAELGEQMGISYQRAAVLEREARQRLRKVLQARQMDPVPATEAG